uniref:Uncharacterized protein n=1 Tax=Solanum lycopersicum TaxID=4081 RepID=A0A3Q7I1F8_SOLLC
LDIFPHGQGKYKGMYVCLCVGDWFGGKTTGKGMFCWPWRAMYEGNFNIGFMDGDGTYSGISGTAWSSTINRSQSI